MAKKVQEKPETEAGIELVSDEMELVPEQDAAAQEAPLDAGELDSIAGTEPVEHGTLADSTENVPIEAVPDGSVMKLVSGSFVVRARESFHDIETKRDYKAGDKVEGWSRERAEKYAARGLVAIEE